MRKLGLTLAIGVLFAGTSAFADASFVTVNGSAGSSVSYSPLNQQTPLGSGQGTNTDANQRGGTDYNSFVNIAPTQVTFESSNVVSGSSVRTNSSSQVDIGLHNATGGDVRFNSTITAAGMGFYVTSPGAGSCLYSSCTPVNPLTGPAFGDLPLPPVGGSGTLATASFDFSVSRAGQDGFLFHRSGTLMLSYNVDGVFVDQSGLDTVSGQLINFRTAVDNGSNIGFLWDATPISFDIGSATDQTLIYSTSVTSSSSVGCIDGPSVGCLIAYSGFGDPVGAAGAVDAAIGGFQGRFGPLSSFGSSPLGGHGLTFGPAVFDTPTFNDGVLTFQPAGVPEPASWMTLILGFGLLGGTLRRRRTVAAI